MSHQASRVVTFLSVLISKWSLCYNVSLAAVTALICISSWLFSILSTFSSFVGHLSSIFPISLSGLNKYLEVNSNDFRRFVSCPKCDTIYEFEKCFVDVAKTIPKMCSFSKFPNHPHHSRRQPCGSQLLTSVVTKDGFRKFYPLI